MNHQQILVQALAATTLLVGCAASPDTTTTDPNPAPAGQQAPASAESGAVDVPASAETTAATGATSWHVTHEGDVAVVRGLDATGTVLLHLTIAQGQDRSLLIEDHLGAKAAKLVISSDGVPQTNELSEHTVGQLPFLKSDLDAASKSTAYGYWGCALAMVGACVGTGITCSACPVTGVSCAICPGAASVCAAMIIAYSASCA